MKITKALLAEADVAAYAGVQKAALPIVLGRFAVGQVTEAGEDSFMHKGDRVYFASTTEDELAPDGLQFAGTTKDGFFRDFAVYEFHRAKLDNLIHFAHRGVIIQARRFNIEADDHLFFQIFGLGRIFKKSCLRIIYVRLGEDDVICLGHGFTLSCHRFKACGWIAVIELCRLEGRGGRPRCRGAEPPAKPSL